MAHDNVSIIRDDEWGFRRLEPIPTDSQLNDFYESQYYELLRKGGRAPMLRRLSGEEEVASKERAWLHGTLYADVAETLRAQIGLGRVLDIGCGTGDLLAYLRDQGFDVTGTELSADASEGARRRGLNVHTMTLDQYVQEHERSELAPFDAIVMINVLEHVPHPIDLLQSSRRLLQDGGVICVRVPNDFSELQSAAETTIDQRGWWINTPDHVNYFDFASLRDVFARLEMQVFHEQSDFPMELFLLMGDNYVASPDTGEACHQRRVRLENAMPADLRRRLYAAFAHEGVGRNCLTFAKRAA